MGFLIRHPLNPLAASGLRTAGLIPTGNLAVGSGGLSVCGLLADEYLVAKFVAASSEDGDSRTVCLHHHHYLDHAGEIVSTALSKIQIS